MKITNKIKGNEETNVVEWAIIVDDDGDVRVTANSRLVFSTYIEHNEYDIFKDTLEGLGLTQA